MPTEYRQNDMSNYETEVAGSSGDENGELKGGNTGLPFGLCKKYGISLPNNATPRDAWSALKGKGIYPPWTAEGKNQYEPDGEHTGKGANEGGGVNEVNPEEQKIKIDKAKKEIYDKIEQKFSDNFGAQYRKRLNNFLTNLNDDEIEVFAKTLDKAGYKQGSGSFSTLSTWYGTNKRYELSVPSGDATDYDKSLGYDFKASTFTHEYGHFLAKLVAIKENSAYSDFNSTTEMQEILKKDADALLGKILSEQGLPNLEEQTNLSHYNREKYELFDKQRNAVYNWINGLVDSKNPKWTWEHKTEPKKSWYIKSRPKMEKKYDTTSSWISDSQREIREKWNAQIDEINNKKKKEYSDYLKSEEYKNHLAKYEERLAMYKEYQEEVGNNKRRNAFISDFIAGATRGRINPQNSGEWGHDDAYWGRHDNGIETWAEFVSFKLTKNSQGLEQFKSLLPNTYNKYEEKFKKLKEIL